MHATLLAIWLAAGAAGPYLHQAAAGKALVLNRPVTIPAHTATVYFQGGAVRPPLEVDDYYPHCLFLSRRVGERPQQVPAGTFSIRRVFTYDEEFARRDAVRLASLVVEAGNGKTSYYFVTRMELGDGPFPDALYFECRQLSDYAVGDHIRLDEFQQAVGEIWALR